MQTSYTAVICDGRIEWTSDPPPALRSGQPVQVRVTFPDPPVAPQRGDGKRVAEILQRIADAGGIASIPDPDAWLREQRQDRPLPGREE